MKQRLTHPLLLALVGMMAVVYVPFLNPIFGTQPLSLAQWGWVLLASFIPALVAEAVKWRLRTWPSPPRSNPAPTS